MCGSETLTTVVSSTSMNVLDITAMAISHGLTSGEAGFGFSAIPYANAPNLYNQCKSSVIFIANVAISLNCVGEVPKLVA